MADPGESFARPMAWWGVIQAAATEHATTADVWRAITAFGESSGLQYPPDMFAQVNAIRSQAVQLRNASEALGSASSTDALTHDYIARLPYARTDPAAAVTPLYDVRVNYTAVQGGQELESYITLRYSGGLPPTVGDLYAEAQLATESLVEGYGAAMTGLGAIQIGEL